MTDASAPVPALACQQQRALVIYKFYHPLLKGRECGERKLPFSNICLYEGKSTSATELKTGRPRCVFPPLPGDTPPTMLVP